MSGNTTVVLRQEQGLSRSETDAYEQELRRLLFCGTIREAREYAEDHDALTVLAKMTRREGTAIAALADKALQYRAILAEFRDMAQGAYSDGRAASRMNALFFKFAEKECDFGLQRLIMETMRAWTKELQGSREKFVADDFFRILADRDAEAAAQAEQRRHVQSQRHTRSLADEVCTRLYHSDWGVPDFINWIGDQLQDDYALIMDLLREGARPDHGCSARAREILRHLEP